MLPACSVGLFIPPEARIQQIETPGGVPISSTRKVLFLGQSAIWTASFSAPVTVTGNPRLALTVGGGATYAHYLSGSGTSALQFKYTPAPGELEATNIVTGAIDLNGGTIVAGGADVSASAQILPPASTLLVDAIPHSLSFQASRYSEEAGENGGNRAVTVSITPAALAPLDVPIVVSGDAVVGVDHDFNLPFVTIPAGATSMSAGFSLINNLTVQGDRRILLSLDRPVGSENVLLSTRDQAMLMIRDDESNGLNFSLISLGAAHSCGLQVGTGSLYCWGMNFSGQVGNGTFVDAITPVQIDPASAYTKVSAGSDHTCAILAGSNTLKCWGANSMGQLGIDSFTNQILPTLTYGALTFSEISAGNGFTCGIRTTGELNCWGSNSSGQVGDGRGILRTTPTTVDAGTIYTRIVAGRNHACGITAAGALKCWGQNAYGQLGDGTTTNRFFPTVIASGTSFSEVAAAGLHTCAIVSGTLGMKCWGNNISGQLGDGSTVDKYVPVDIDTGTSYSRVSAKESQTCGLLSGSSILKCWGANSSGQLGDGFLSNRSTPIKIDQATAYSQVSMGAVHTCAIVSPTGALRCWGDRSNGRHGDRVSLSERNPIGVDPRSTYSKVEVGNAFGCGVSATSGAIRCWGRNSNNQLGDRTEIPRSSPTRLGLEREFSSVSAGGLHACGIEKTSGALYCWGDNANGQLGVVISGGATSASVPLLVDAATSYKQVSSGSLHTCGITTAGTLKCWGGNSNGQLGDGSSIVRNTPVAIDAMTQYLDVSAGQNHTCGVTTSGALKCWGNNSNGELGDGTFSSCYSPVVISSGSAYNAVSAGYYSTCAILSSTRLVQCWGYNGTGVLGDNTGTSRNVPALISDASTPYAQVSVGSVTACGVTQAGILKCWGSNDKGQAGQPDLNLDYISPTVVDSGVTFGEVSAGKNHACAITTAGLLKCFGANDSGQLGNGLFKAVLPQFIPSP